LKGLEIPVAEGGVGWVAEHRQVLIGGSPLADLQKPLGEAAAAYRSNRHIPARARQRSYRYFGFVL
jgi:hypothetical protein